MSPESDPYNLAAIRKLIKDAFTAKGLWRFCQERPKFRPVMADFGFNPTLADMTDVLLEYCCTQLRFDELLAGIHAVSPRQYERYEAQLYGDSTEQMPELQIPHNLPPRSEFVGREAEKARIHEALCSRAYLISIDGMGGIGKTALALEVAYECLHASQSDDRPEGIVTFDSFVWTTAKDRELTLNILLDAIALTFDYPGIVQRPLDQKQIGAEKLLRERPCLLIVDNFETVTDDGVRDFLRYLPEPSKALITTREQNLDGVSAISLKGLDEAEALMLIRAEGQRLGLDSIKGADDKTLLYLHKATGGAPLALKWAVGQIKQRGQSLDTILAALYEARGDIFEDIFARSWKMLSLEAQQVLMVMPLFVDPAAREAIGAASDIHHFALNEALGQLVEMSLVDVTDEIGMAQQRFSIHRLTRAFAEAKQKEKPETRDAAHRRLADFFAAFAKEHGGFGNPTGFTKLEHERSNILATIEWCWAQQLVDLGCNIFFNIIHFMINYGYWNEAMKMGQHTAHLPFDSKVKPTMAIFFVWPVAWIYRHRGDLDSAEKWSRQALSIYRDLKHKGGVAHSKRELGRIAHERGDLKQAEQWLSEALDYYQAQDSHHQVFLTTTNLAEVTLEMHDLEKAQTLCSSVLLSARKFDNPERIAALLYILGLVEYQRGNYQQTRSYWEESLTYMQQANRLDGIAGCLIGLARIDIAMGERQTAKDKVLKALETYRKLDMSSKVQETQALLGELHNLIGFEE